MSSFYWKTKIIFSNNRNFRNLFVSKIQIIKKIIIFRIIGILKFVIFVRKYSLMFEYKTKFSKQKFGHSERWWYANKTNAQVLLRNVQNHIISQLFMFEIVQKFNFFFSDFENILSIKYVLVAEQKRKRIMSIWKNRNYSQLSKILPFLRNPFILSKNLQEFILKAGYASHVRNYWI